MEPPEEDEPEVVAEPTHVLADVLKSGATNIIDVARWKTNRGEESFAMEVLSGGLLKFPNGEKMKMTYIMFCREMGLFGDNKFDELEQFMMQVLRKQMQQGKPMYRITPYESLFYPFQAHELRLINLLSVTEKKPKTKLVEFVHPVENIGGNKRKIKICYISSGLRDHTTTHLIQGVLRQHDKSKFHITCISTMDGQSDDEFVENLKCYCIEYVRLDPLGMNMTPKKIAEILAGYKFDIIIDLIGPTYTSVLQAFHYKPAPLIVGWLGYPSSSGHSSIDYIVVDQRLAPWPECSNANQEAWFVEKPAYMPNSYYIGDHMNMFPHLKYSTMVMADNDEKLILNCCEPVPNCLQYPTEIRLMKTMLEDEEPKILLHGHTVYNGKWLYLEQPRVVKGLEKLQEGIVVTSRAQYGLAENQIIYANFNDSKKLSKEFMSNVIEILHGVAGSLLWVNESNEFVMTSLREFLVKNGLADNRIYSSPYKSTKEENVRRGVLVDLFLDPWLCNGHSTSLDALWSGTPLLTLTGHAFHTRVSTSLLDVLHLPVLCAPTQEEFVKRAIFLGINQPALFRLRNLINNRKLISPLFDTTMFTHDWESLLSLMWEKYTIGEQHDHIPPDTSYMEWTRDMMPPIMDFVD